MTPANESKMDETSPKTEPLLPGEDEVDRANRLRAGGLTVGQVAEALGRSERQVYRLLSRGRERLPRSRYKKWSIWSSRKNDEPIEMAEYLFGTDAEAGWMQDEALWAWQIHCLRPGLDPHFVSALARFYESIDNLDEDDRSHRARLVDLAIRYEPWVDEEHRHRYFDAVPARNVGDLEYAARLAWYMDHISGRYAEHVVLVPVPIVEDQVETLERMVERTQDELDRDTARVKVIMEPGRGEKDT